MPEIIRSKLMPLSANSIKLDFPYGAEILCIRQGVQGVGVRIFYRYDPREQKIEPRVFCVYTQNTVYNTIRGTYLGSIDAYTNSWHVFEEHEMENK